MAKQNKQVVDKKKVSGLLAEFKEFIGDSSVIDMAIGVLVGGALSKIVTSLVNDIFMPLIGILIGGVDFSSLTFQFHGATVNYGTFIMNVVDFLIISICLFVCVKMFLNFRHKMNPEEDPSYKKKTDEKILLLREIRDSLKKDDGQENSSETD